MPEASNFSLPENVINVNKIMMFGHFIYNKLIHTNNTHASWLLYLILFSTLDFITNISFWESIHSPLPDLLFCDLGFKMKMTFIFWKTLLGLSQMCRWMVCTCWARLGSFCPLSHYPGSPHHRETATLVQQGENRLSTNGLSTYEGLCLCLTASILILSNR